MSIRVALNHVTHDRYDRLVELSPQVVRLRPSPHCCTPVHSYSMRAEPAEHFINWQQDAFANYQARLVFPHKTREGAHWVTGPWFFRDERMYLIPGDSPMGYRLPLDSLPCVSKSDYPYQHAHDPFAPPSAPLRTPAELRMQHQGESAGAAAAAKAASAARGTGSAINARIPAHSEFASWVHRTALCVEARDQQMLGAPTASA